MMKCAALKKIRLIYLTERYNAFWRRDVKFLRKSICMSNASLTETVPPDARILVLAPHSDDEWIGCSSLINRFECKVCSMDMPGGNDEKIRSVRFDEMVEMSHRFEYALTRLLGNNKTDDLKEIASAYKPDYIAVPFFIDWHEEHIYTMLCLKNALDNYSCKIIMYQVSCPLPFSAVNYAVSLEKDEWVKKWRFFKKVYKSQKSFPWKRFAYIEKAQCSYCKSYASNVFCIVN